MTLCFNCDGKMEEDLRIQDKSLLAEMEDFLNETSLSVPPFSKQQEFEASTPRREENTEPCKKFVLKPIVWTTQEPENPSGKPSGTTTKKASKTPEEIRKERERLNQEDRDNNPEPFNDGY